MGLQARGYEIAVAGVNQWNGVALISRVGLEDVTVGFADMPGYGEPLAAEARAIGATAGGVRIWSLYVPNGRKPDDPHYVYKLDWLSRLRAAATPWLDEETVPVGDWNICPTDADVFDPAQFAKSTHVTPPERAAFPGVPRRRLRRGHPRARPGLHLLGLLPPALRARPWAEDRLRARVPRAREAVTGAFIDRDERDPARGTGSPSDHAPVIVDIA
ncbi:exodeoxyribonuclease III [Nocardioides sp. B-3]|uniref:exodeoxyribonuclease III n=1 Tax=Nocardioides sp. B-3 TaxID=2895565 RepID=UPI0021525571|nr:exodeoxyribonuclease III [Nocardioides sp. B-3]UUZ60224.1 exodeoxyribonuclease III [Nocardioides sp. B-3]